MQSPWRSPRVRRPTNRHHQTRPPLIATITELGAPSLASATNLSTDIPAPMTTHTLPPDANCVSGETHTPLPSSTSSSKPISTAAPLPAATLVPEPTLGASATSTATSVAKKPPTASATSTRTRTAARTKTPTSTEHPSQTETSTPTTTATKTPKPTRLPRFVRTRPPLRLPSLASLHHWMPTATGVGSLSATPTATPASPSAPFLEWLIAWPLTPVALIVAVSLTLLLLWMGWKTS